MEYIKNNLIKIVKSSGIESFDFVKKEDIITSTVFRDICISNSCGNFNKCYMCPPDVGEINSLINELKSYREGLIYETAYQLEDSFDFEGMMDGINEHAKYTIEIGKKLKATNYDFLHLAAGGCHLCDICGKVTNEPCRHPDLALPPIECYGIDVYNTLINTKLKYNKGPNTVTYFGLILFN